MSARAALARVLASALACTALGCGDDMRAPIEVRRLGLGSPPAVRPVLRGAHAFVRFEQAWSDRESLHIAMRAWPEHAVPARALDVLADCAASPDGTASIDFIGREAGQPVQASIRWRDLCPREPMPEHASFALQLLDVCVRDVCETLAGTIDVAPFGERWPEPVRRP